MKTIRALLCVLLLPVLVGCAATGSTGRSLANSTGNPAALGAEEDGWELVGTIVARIDNEALTLSDLDIELAISRFLTAKEGGERTRRAVIDAIIKRRLLVSEAQKLRLEAEKEEVLELLGTLFANAGGEEPFWSEMAAVPVAESSVFSWVRELILMRKYIKLRRQTTFVSESELIAFFYANHKVFGFAPLSEVHDEVRDYLAGKKHQKQLSQWMDKQAKKGRVRVVETSKGER